MKQAETKQRYNMDCSASTWGAAVTAESVPQEQNRVNFELCVDNYDRNREQYNEGDGESQGKVTGRRRRTCEEIREQDGFETRQ